MAVLKPESIINGELDWSKKIDKVIFRGNPTGCGIRPDTNMRLKISKMNYEWLDAGITTNKSRIRYDAKYGLGYMKLQDIKPVNRKSFEEQSMYKYIVNIDGNVAAYRLLLWLLTGSVCLRVKSDYILWYDDLLKEGEHYISIKEDLSDLEEKYKWCQKNDKKCKKIAKAGYKFAMKYLNRNIIEKAFLNKIKQK